MSNNKNNFQLTRKRLNTIMLAMESSRYDTPASPDEAGMAMDQARFIAYVAEEIMEYIEGENEFPEWMQNKLSALHEKAKNMHAVMAGKYKDDDVNEGSCSTPSRSMKKTKSEQVECPQCKGKGCDHCDGKGYHAEGAVKEKLTVADGMGAWINDFKNSDAPQFKGKSKEERRDMAISAYLSAKKK